MRCTGHGLDGDGSCGLLVVGSRSRPLGRAWLRQFCVLGSSLCICVEEGRLEEERQGSEHKHREGPKIALWLTSVLSELDGNGEFM